MKFLNRIILKAGKSMIKLLDGDFKVYSSNNPMGWVIGYFGPDTGKEIHLLFGAMAPSVVIIRKEAK